MKKQFFIKKCKKITIKIDSNKIEIKKSYENYIFNKKISQKSFFIFLFIFNI